jgi:hypothetical protein
MEADVITLQDVFTAKPPDEESQSTGRAARLLSPLAPTGLKPHFLEKMATNGVVMPPHFFRRTEGEGTVVSFPAPSYGAFQ